MEESEYTAGMYILSYFTKLETRRQKKIKGERKGNENILLKFIQYSYFSNILQNFASGIFGILKAT